MSINGDAQRTQLLDEPPHFGTAGADLVTDLCATHGDPGVGGEHADDLSQAHVGLLDRNYRRSGRTQAGWPGEFDERHYARAARKGQICSGCLLKEKAFNRKGRKGAAEGAKNDSPAKEEVLKRLHVM